MFNIFFLCERKFDEILGLNSWINLPSPHQHRIFLIWQLLFGKKMEIIVKIQGKM